jgi:hypothetical protein
MRKHSTFHASTRCFVQASQPSPHAVAHRAVKESWSYRDFLALMLAEEVARRKQTRLQRFTRSARATQIGP